MPPPISPYGNRNPMQARPASPPASPLLPAWPTPQGLGGALPPGIITRAPGLQIAPGAKMLFVLALLAQIATSPPVSHGAPALTPLYQDPPRAIVPPTRPTPKPPECKVIDGVLWCFSR
jgi:hypothetical protein